LPPNVGGRALVEGEGADEQDRLVVAGAIDPPEALDELGDAPVRLAPL